MTFEFEPTLKGLSFEKTAKAALLRYNGSSKRNMKNFCTKFVKLLCFRKFKLSLKPNSELLPTFKTGLFEAIITTDRKHLTCWQEFGIWL